VSTLSPEVNSLGQEKNIRNVVENLTQSRQGAKKNNFHIPFEVPLRLGERLHAGFRPRF